jgi:hypothetical protein
MFFLDKPIRSSFAILGLLSIAAILAAACSQANTGPQTNQPDSTVQAGNAGGPSPVSDTSTSPVDSSSTTITAEASVPSSDATTQQTDAGTDASDCLSCHGPYSKVEQGSSGYVTPTGETVNPHTTVDSQNRATAWDSPHLSGTDNVECSTCHQSSPMPPASIDAVPKANINYCYQSGCHHTQTFQSCKSASCHQVGG